MTVGVLTTCHTQYTSDSSICVFLFNRTTLQVFVTYVTGALYVHPLWFYKHQHDNQVRSACQRWWFQWWFWFVPSVPRIHTHLVSWNCAYHRQMELSDGGCFPNYLWNCRWTIVPRQSFWITLYLAESLLIRVSSHQPCRCTSRALDLYLEGPQFEYRPEHSLFWLTCLLVFLIPCRETGNYATLFQILCI